MARKFMHVATAALLAVLHAISAVAVCPNDPNCVCGGTFATEIDCNINGQIIRINMLPSTYLSIKCENATYLDYNELPKFENQKTNFKSVSFKDCPLPSSSFNDVLTNLGVAKTMALIFQNTKNLRGDFDRKHFSGLQDLTKLLLSVNGVASLPDNLFMDLNKLTWLNIRSNTITLSEELFKPLERLETLEISHNHMTNITSNLFSHLSYLRKLSLWQSNVTWFSKDFFSGVDVLEELDLSSNGLNELPPSIFKPLRKLKKLTLFSNKFTTLPQNLFSSNDELQTIVILNNDVKLKTLPKNFFSGLRNLKQVYVHRSGIEQVPKDVFANSPNITNISLAHNDIETLPELVFNDQINLLELDLSYNRLRELEPKLFSSLVRLERLTLCHNKLITMDGSTFSSLLSLIYLNMENNNITTITSPLFGNNKQKMTISLAYNKLSFEKNEKGLNWTLWGVSPFYRTSSLRLLNLSHNEFTRTFDDWWINGHDILDISYNAISDLWVGDNQPTKYMGICYLRNTRYKVLLNRPMQQVWISGNPLACDCYNFGFIDFLQKNLKAKVIEGSCPTELRALCYLRMISNIIHIAIILIGTSITVYLYIRFRKNMAIMLKEKFTYNKYIVERDIDIKYSDKDEEFVLKEVVPVLRNQKNLKIKLKPINKQASKFVKFFTKEDPYQTVVIFSPNYLTSAYSHVNIKKIRGQMLKAKNTVYVFTDIGPENSIYAFLKNQSDQQCTVLWSDSDFWNKFLAMLPGNKDYVTLSDFEKYKIYPEYPIILDKPQEFPPIFKDSFNYSQV